MVIYKRSHGAMKIHDIDSRIHNEVVLTNIEYLTFFVYDEYEHSFMIHCFDYSYKYLFTFVLN